MRRQGRNRPTLYALTSLLGDRRRIGKSDLALRGPTGPSSATALTLDAETLCCLAFKSQSVKVVLQRLGAMKMTTKRIRAITRRIQLPLPLLETTLFLALLAFLAYSG